MHGHKRNYVKDFSHMIFKIVFFRTWYRLSPLNIIGYLSRPLWDPLSKWSYLVLYMPYVKWHEIRLLTGDHTVHCRFILYLILISSNWSHSRPLWNSPIPCIHTWYMPCVQWHQSRRPVVHRVGLLGWLRNEPRWTFASTTLRSWCRGVQIGGAIMVQPGEFVEGTVGYNGVTDTEESPGLGHRPGVACSVTEGWKLC